VTTPPDFFDLVGDEGTPGELEKLRRAHDLLVAAGPPPELTPRLSDAPRVGQRKAAAFGRRRPATVLALAAVLAIAAFFVGYAVGNQPSGFSAARTIPMHGVGRLTAAHADLAIGSRDVGGNYPLKMTVRGLPQLQTDGWYELLLSKGGRPTLSCGSFRVDGRSLTVRMSVPYDLGDFPKLFDGWVVLRHLPKEKNQAVVMTT
jgi:hypothetical protein